MRGAVKERRDECLGTEHRVDEDEARRASRAEGPLVEDGEVDLDPDPDADLGGARPRKAGLKLVGMVAGGGGSVAAASIWWEVARVAGDS